MTKKMAATQLLEVSDNLALILSRLKPFFPSPNLPSMSFLVTGFSLVFGFLGRPAQWLDLELDAYFFEVPTVFPCPTHLVSHHFLGPATMLLFIEVDLLNQTLGFVKSVPREKVEPGKALV